MKSKRTKKIKVICSFRFSRPALLERKVEMLAALTCYPRLSPDTTQQSIENFSFKSFRRLLKLPCGRSLNNFLQLKTCAYQRIMV